MLTTADPGTADPGTAGTDEGADFWDDPPWATRRYEDRDDEPWEESWPEPAPTPRARPPFTERLRRGVLLLAGAGATAVALTAAPWLTAAVLVVLVWLLRSGSLAASAAGRRRELRGRRWYDGALFLLGTPWDLVRSVPGALLLLLWSTGLAAAGALLCYAFGAGAETTLMLSGLVLALGLWSGPGASRLRGPVGRVVVPLSRRGSRWLLALALVLAVTAVLGWQVASGEIAWTPWGGPPFAGVEAPQVPGDLGDPRGWFGR